MTPSPRGVLVTLDGPGGAGKTTLARLVTEQLTAANIPVHATTEPSRGQLGEIARHHTDTYRGLALACLVAADRYHHLDTEIRPALATGHVVLCDRYLASSYVLQRIDGVDVDFLRTVNAYADRPGLAVILTADPDVLGQRLANRGSHGRFENTPGAVMNEAQLFTETTEQLSADGVPVVTLDSTATPAESLATSLTATILALRSAPWPSATAPPSTST